VHNTGATLIPQTDSNRPAGINSALLDGSASWYAYDDDGTQLEVGINYAFIQSKPSGF
jgi:hypothetical protein